MSGIKNVKNDVQEKYNINREQIEHRATWMGLIYDELTKAGIDAEPILRKAIRKCGNIHGQRFIENGVSKDDCSSFHKLVFADVGVNTFNMKDLDSGKDHFTVEFQYCALVSAWQKLGFDDETCNKLCDIAMDGDRGIAEALGYDFDLSATIADCKETCKLNFHK